MPPTRHIVPVRLPHEADRSYRIEIRQGAFRDIHRTLRSILGDANAFIITDSTVARLYGRSLRDRLRAAGTGCALIAFPPGEESKNATLLHGIHTALLEEGVKRGSLIIALGGGVVGDLAGFAAATILRGIRFVQIPTTLLAQVDSSTGGKVGIDHPHGKNLIGAFHQPERVWIDPDLLRTLPDREYRNGLAEVVKIATGLDGPFFRFLEKHSRTISRRSKNILPGIIARAVGLKAAVVEQDERESGLRKVLNLGHTIGHAVEAASAFRIPHGAAVAIGLVCEARLALQLGLMRAQEVERVIRLCAAFGLPTRIPPRIEHAAFRRALLSDKKGNARGPAFALPAGIGSSALDVQVDGKLLRSVTGIEI